MTEHQCRSSKICGLCGELLEDPVNAVIPFGAVEFHRACYESERHGAEGTGCSGRPLCPFPTPCRQTSSKPISRRGLDVAAYL